MKVFKFRSFVFCLVGFLLFTPEFTLCHAQTLESVLASSELKIVAKSKRPKVKKFLKTGTNFSRLFLDNPEKIIAGWVGTTTSTTSEIRFVDHHSRKRVTHLSYQQWYKNYYSNREAIVEILVPRPDAVPSIEADLDPDFAKLKPPLLRFSEVFEYTMHSTTAKLMLNLEDNSALLLLPIERHGIVKITTAKWQDRELLLEIAKNLNIKRLNEKLLS